MFFSNTNRTNLTNLLGCNPVCIRGIREICGHLNIIHTRICFFNHESHESNESLGYDPVCIRGIREIRGQLNTPVILHSICSMALCEPAATELESKNTHGLSQMQRSLFHGFVF